MKKRAYLAFVLILAFSVIAFGCSSGSNTPKNSTQNENKGTNESSNGSAGGNSELAPYEINMVYMGNDSEEMDLVAAEMSKITKEKINATVKLQPINAGAWAQQVNLMLASQEKIDVIMSSALFGFSTQAVSGYFLPLDELLEKHGKGIVGLMDKEYMDAGKINGTQYAIPTNRDLAGQGGIILRKDLAEKYNIDLDAIKTMDDLDAVFEVIKQNEPNMIPLAYISTTSPIEVVADYDLLSDGNGVLPGLDNNFVVENYMESPEYAASLKKMRDWYLKGYISKDAATNTEPTVDMVKAGKAFAFFNTMKVGTSESQTLRIGKPMVAIPLTEARSTTSNATSFMHSIPRGSGDPERAMMFLELLYTDKELVNLLNWGIEGQHYVVKSGNVIDYPEGIDATTVKYNTNNISYMFGNQFLNYVWPNQLTDIWEQTAEYNKVAKKSKALGFTFDVTPVKTEVGAVNNVKQQFKSGLETGTLDPDKVLPDYLNRLKQAGLEKIITEKQKQLDAWVESMK